MLKLSLRLASLMLSTVILAGCGGDSTKVNPTSKKASPSSAAEAGSNNAQPQNGGESTKDASTSEVKVQDIKLVKKKEKTKYLISNGIEFLRPERVINTSKGNIRFPLVQISGLSDKDLEKKLNSTIESDLVNSIKDYAIEADSDTPMELYCNVGLNANNLLSISIVNLYSPPLDAFLYRLTDGKKLALKDIFTPGSDFTPLVNRAVTEVIAGTGSEENLLREPFSSIRKDQSFFLTETELYIIFHKGECGFSERNSIALPLSSIDDYVDVSDRYTDVNSSKYEKTNLIVKKNNIFTTQKGNIVKRSNGEIWTYYPEMSGLNNSELQQAINTRLKDAVDEVLKSKVLDSLKKKTGDPGNCIAAIQLDPVFNSYGFLYICRTVYSFADQKNLPGYTTVYAFDLNKGAEVNPQSLLLNYLKKDINLEGLFMDKLSVEMKQTCSNLYGFNLDDQINSLLDMSFVKNKGFLFFRQYGSVEEAYICVLFKENSFKGVSSPIECQIPFRDIVSIPPEDFFGR
ncbi:MAG: hypothetical protein Q8930_01150 [Bacillota bacterium]|nr:hypothetical protein [Bacillota bacterium]